MTKEVVIVGGGVAGIFVLRNLFAKKEEVPEGLHITLIKREKSGWVSTCGLPFALRGWYELERTEIQKPEFYLEQGIDFRAAGDVTKLNLDEKNVAFKTSETINYDCLVIATGRKQSVKETTLDGVFTFNNEDDACEIEAALNTRDVKNAFIRGRGIIGLQSAAAFSERGIKTTVLGGPPSLLPSSLDPDMGDIVKERMEKEGVRFILDRREITAMKGKNGWVKSVVIGATEAEREEIPAEIVIIGKWMVPETDLAKDAGIEIGEAGGIVTDRSMHVKKGKSSLNNVYALGDCTEVVDGITHRPKLNQMASTAVVQARVIADSILSDIKGQPSLYSLCDDCISPTVADIGGGLLMGSVGVTTDAANRAGMKTISGKATKLIKARYFPGATSLTLKLIFDAFTKKLIGAQMCGEATVAERVNEFAIAIRVGMTAAELRNMERCFDPSLAQLEDVTIDAAKNALESV
ncbi:MAG TPA: FAD-dependent oxidoreductase [Candidatus Bathyarchaeia archaeon]|nr:FAD-dependent oxidoreductase [Candidatus Bathyarchaeia archaeon]